MTLSVDSIRFKPYDVDLDRAVRKTVFGDKPRRCWHVCTRTIEGQTGWGDIAPWPGFSESATEIDRRIHQLETSISPVQFEQIADMEIWLDGLDLEPVIRFGLELSFLDLFAQQRGVPIAALLDPNYATELSIHALVDSAETAVSSVEAGADAIKVKLSDTWRKDVERIRDIRQAVPLAKIRIDANGAWPERLAKKRVRELSELGVDIIEQPVSGEDIDGLKAVASTCEMTLSADESVCVDAEAVLAIDALNEIVLKPMYLGGLVPSYELAQKAYRRGLKVCVTHALESKIGRTGAAHLAAASDALKPATHGISGAWNRSAMEIMVPRTPGLGVSVQ
ncbi:MAG: enolase C-terminal domain-like protein [Myxococcota bacterium]|nr:enolase C-terminal domain-like protein [Myxococcota bacterium]